MSPALASVHTTVNPLFLPSSRLFRPSRMSSFASVAPLDASVAKSTVATLPAGLPL